MGKKAREEIISNIDHEGLWYWIWQKYYRRWANEIPMEVLREMMKLSEQMETVRKMLDVRGFLA